MEQIVFSENNLCPNCRLGKLVHESMATRLDDVMYDLLFARCTRCGYGYLEGYVGAKKEEGAA